MGGVEKTAESSHGAPQVRADNAILVWRWDDAPEELRELSYHGGDEDWVALFPNEDIADDATWSESYTRFGCCEVSEHLLPDGRVVRIGAHA